MAPARKLIIYPTSRALRQVQRRALERKPFFDGRGHISLAAFLGGCEEAARLAGLLRDPAGRPLEPIDDLKGGIAVVETAERFFSEPPAAPTVLGRLSRKGLEETLEQLIAYLSPLAGKADDFLEILSADSASPRHRELAALYRVYRVVCGELGVADPPRVNTAALRLLRLGRPAWPSFLREVSEITLAGVRWVGPFVELVIRALEEEPDPVPVTVSHILEVHEQEWWGSELMSGAGRLIFGEEEEERESGYFERSTREALDRIREGYAMCDPNLAGEGRNHIAFSRSVGRYGEVEDLARRIVWETRLKPDPVRPEEICLTARDLAPYADAIRSVFPRFGIPFNFRRGLPVLSAPVVKVIFRFLELSATGSREAFCALLESPWPDWGGIPAGRLADDIRRSGVEPEIASPRELKARLAAYYRRRPPEEGSPKELLEAAGEAWRRAKGPASPGSPREGLSELLVRIEDEFALPRRVRELAGDSEGSADARWGYLFNGRAYAAVRRTLELLRDYSPAGPVKDWEEVSRLAVRGLEGLDVFPLPPDESGVWILSPYDIGGLKFKVVIAADLTSGSFPRLPLESPIFPDRELEEFRRKLGEGIPVTALATSGGRAAQENLLGGSASYAAIAASFFAPVGMVGVVGRDFPEEHLELFKQRRIDLEGVEFSEGETFRWTGEYMDDMNDRETLEVALNVLESWRPKVGESQKNSTRVNPSPGFDRLSTVTGPISPVLPTCVPPQAAASHPSISTTRTVSPAIPSSVLLLKATSSRPSASSRGSGSHVTGRLSQTQRLTRRSSSTSASSSMSVVVEKSTRTFSASMPKPPYPSSSNSLLPAP